MKRATGFIASSVCLLAMVAAGPATAYMVDDGVSSNGLTSHLPLRVLIVSGGGYHDYALQRTILETGLEARLNVTITHAFYDLTPNDNKKRPALPIYKDPLYGAGFDLIIHNECAADESDPETIATVLAPHRQGIPAVNLHCAIHSYRSGDWKTPAKLGADNAKWFEFLGLQSTGNGPPGPIALSPANNQHPIAKGLASWTTPDEELYNNISTFGIDPVIIGRQTYGGQEKPDEATVAWTNVYGPARARVFALTLAHSETTMVDPRFLELVARGVAWATGHLNDDGTYDTKIALQRVGQ